MANTLNDNNIQNNKDSYQSFIELQIELTNLISKQTILIEPNISRSNKNEDMHYDKFDLKENLKKIEKIWIKIALITTENNRLNASKILGIKYRNLRYRIHNLDL